jgi:hypothetical protein
MEPATFRLVAQYLYQLRYYRVSLFSMMKEVNLFSHI